MFGLTNGSICIILAVIALVAIIIFIFTYNNKEGFNSTDYYWAPPDVNERSLNPNIYLQKQLNIRTDFRAKPNDLSLSGVNPPKSDFLHMIPYSTYKDDINPELYALANRWKPDWMRDSTNVNSVYGKAYYYDKRFLEQAIDIEYAKDPEKYCSLHPDIYPCLNSGYSGGV